MKAVFFELEGWEKPYLEARLPTGHKYEFLLHRCTLDDLLLIGDADIISTFIFWRCSESVRAFLYFALMASIFGCTFCIFFIETMLLCCSG